MKLRPISISAWIHNTGLKKNMQRTVRRLDITGRVSDPVFAYIWIRVLNFSDCGFWTQIQILSQK